jgi:hypothetical protein
MDSGKILAPTSDLVKPFCVSFVKIVLDRPSAPSRHLARRIGYNRER